MAGARLGVSARDLLLLQVVQELHPVVGAELPPARHLQDPHTLHRGLLRLSLDLRTQQLRTDTSLTDTDETMRMRHETAHPGGDGAGGGGGGPQEGGWLGPRLAQVGVGHEPLQPPVLGLLLPRPVPNTEVVRDLERTSPQP